MKARLGLTLALTFAALFAALPGTKVNGVAFMQDAVARGAVAVLGHPDAAATAAALGVRFIADENPRAGLAHLASLFFTGQPAIVAAVTGTKGKSSIVAFLREIWTALGKPAASLGTVGVIGPKGETPLAHTTPDPIEIHELLSRLKQDGVELKQQATSAYGAPALLAAKTLRGEFDATLNYWNICAELEAKGLRRVAGIEDILPKLGARGPAAEHAIRLCLMKRAADSPGGVTRSPVARTGRQPPADAEAESAAEAITAARAVSPGASTTRCAVAVVSAAAQERAQNLGEILLVFRDENPNAARSLGVAHAATEGRRMRKTLPSPTTLSTSMRPPCSVTIA